ncbi:MAG: hypothetical protein H6822_11660 [Planctomycetaceae bacterium]|nr:hypothetical protein [Planctomycetales bacterium]MCB9922832.1 hypothetical protein [Planctomycetaceae bacterium]
MTDRACQLCGRITKRGTTQHHLIPRTCHGNKWFKKRFTREDMRMTVALCRACHNAIHELIPDEKELGREFNTLEKLCAHAEVGKFVSWVRKQK